MKYARDLLARGDGRAKHVKDLRRRFGTIVQDLGGPEELSSIELQRCERLAHAEHWLSRLEAITREKGLIVPPPQIMQQYMALSYLALRLGDGLGTKRRTKRVPSLAEYMQARTPAAPKAAPLRDAAEGEVE